MKKLFTLLLLLFSLSASAQYFDIVVYDNCTQQVLENYPMGFAYSSPGFYGPYEANTQPSGQPDAGHYYPWAYDNNLCPGNTCTFAGTPYVKVPGATIASGGGMLIHSGGSSGNTYGYVYVNNPTVTLYTINKQVLSKTQSNPTTITYCPGNQLTFNNTSSWAPNIQQSELIISYGGNQIYSSGWQAGNAFTNFNLATPTYIGGNPSAGVYTITLKNIFCGSTQSVDFTTYLNLSIPAAPSIASLDVNGVSQTGSAPAVLVICNSLSPTLNSTVYGPVDAYNVEVETGSWNGSSFSTSSSQNSGWITSSSVPSVDLSPYLAGYVGDIRVTLTVRNICGNAVSQSEMLTISYATPINAVAYNINGKTQTSSCTVPIIWQCNGSTALNLTPSISGTASVYSITVTKGTFSSCTFNQGTNASVTTGNTAYNISGSVDVYSLFSSYLNGYSGILKVDFYVNGPCGTATTVTQYFNVQLANAAVDFTVQGIGGCQQQRQTSSTLPALSQPASAPFPCTGTGSLPDGWLGANTAGIYGYNITSNTTTNTYNLLVEDVTQSLTIVDYTSSSAIPPYSNFNYYAGLGSGIGYGWLQNNYNTIKNNDLFKITVKVNTAGCGDVSNYSYFEIVDGGTAGAYYRLAPNNKIVDIGVQVYPSPTTDFLNVKWANTTLNQSDMTISMSDARGRVVLTNVTISQPDMINTYQLPVQHLPSGIYFYKVLLDGNVYTGKCTKL